MSTNETILDAQTNMIIRDGFAMEVFFGDLDGETVSAEDLSLLPVPYKYLLDMRSTAGYKAVLYLDALARQIDYYSIFAGAKLSQDPIVHIKAPLYIPTEILDSIKLAFSKGYFLYIEKSMEVFKGFDEILKIWEYHNNELIPKYVSYIQAEGALENKPTKQFFSKTSENKRRVIEAFEIFRNMLEESKESVEFFAENLNATPLFSLFNKQLIKQNVFDIDTQQEEAISNFLTFIDKSKKNRIVCEDGQQHNFHFSLLSPERPIFQKGTVKAENPYSVADMLLYSEAAFSGKKNEEVLSIIYTVGQIYGNEAFEERIREMLLMGEKYEEAYAKIGRHSKNDILHKSYLQEVHEVTMDHFASVLEDEVKADLKDLLSAEAKKSKQNSAFVISKESFAFSFVLYVIRNVFKRKIHLLPKVQENKVLEDIQRKKLKKTFRKILDECVPEYLQYREKYIKEKYEDAKEVKKALKEKEDSANKEKKEEANDAKESAKQREMPNKEKKVKVETAVAEEQEEEDSGEADSKISKELLNSVLSDF